MAREYLTPDDVAKMFMVKPDTVHDWVQKGLLEAQAGADDACISVQQLESFALLRGLEISPVEKPALRVLVVDDDKKICKSISEKIIDLDDKVVIEAAYDGFEAGWKVEAFNPDLILLDLMMPGQDGYTVCRQLKNDPQTRHIRIIAMTSFNANSKIERIMNAGAEMCLSKPIDVSALATSIGLVNRNVHDHI